MDPIPDAHAADFTDLGNLPTSRSKPNEWDVADIAFGKKSMFEIDYYQKLTVIRNEYIKIEK